MRSAEARGNHASSDAAAGTVDMHLEVQIIPVSDVDRSKQFYQRLGWRLDDDVTPLDGLRIVQFTAPGLGRLGHVRHWADGGRAGLGRGRLIVAGIEAARGDLAGRGIRRERDLARPAVASRGPAAPAPTPCAPATGRSSPSPTRTATLGWYRRSPRGCPAASTPRARPLRPQPTWPARCGGPRWPTAHEKRTRRSHLFSPAGPRRGLARLVRRLPGGRAGRDGPASVTGFGLARGRPGCSTGAAWPQWTRPR